MPTSTRSRFATLRIALATSLLVAAIVAVPATASQALVAYDGLILQDAAGNPVSSAGVSLYHYEGPIHDGNSFRQDAFGLTDSTGHAILYQVGENWMTPWTPPAIAQELYVSVNPRAEVGTRYTWDGAYFDPSAPGDEVPVLFGGDSGAPLFGQLTISQAGGSISGTVTTVPEAELHGDVQVTLFSGEDYATWSAADLDAGNYKVTNLEPGSYDVRFWASSSASAPYGYESLWWDGVESYDDATTISVGSSDVPGINATLHANGRISGTFYEYVDGLARTFPIDPDSPDGYVSVYPVDSTPEAEDAYLLSAYTDDSTYEADVPAGDYHVAFGTVDDDNFTPEQYFYLEGAPEEAAVVTVTSNEETSGVDALYGAPAGTPTIPSDRLAGQGRFDTAADVASEFDVADVVYVANGFNYPDALSAAPAAAFLDAPLLLTDPNTLPEVIADQILRLEPDRIVIAGGTGVVSTAVETALEALLPGDQVDRLGGQDRYETSRLITEDAFGTTGAENAFIATGSNFPDALSASAAAGELEGPVILVDGGAATIDAATLELLDDLGTTDAYLAGGTGVVSTGIETQLSTLLGAGNVERLSGIDRYGTSIAINTGIFTTATTVYLAVGTGYADALAGAALAGKNHAPLFIVPGNCVPQDVIDAIESFGTDNVTLLGGEGVLTASVKFLLSC